MGRGRSAALLAFALLLAALALPAAAFAADTTPPVTTLVVPSQYSPTYFRFSMVVVDESPYTSWYAVDGANPKTVTATNETWIPITEGPHTLTYWSVDSAGNSEAPQEYFWWVDNTPPVVTSNIVDGSKHNTPVSIELAAQDVTSTPTVYYSLYDTDGGGPLVESIEYTQPFTVSETGNYAVYYYAVDPSGNHQQGALTFSVDCVAPQSQIDVYYPYYVEGDWYTSDVQFNFYAWDPDGRGLGPGAVYYRIDGGPWTLFGYGDAPGAPVVLSGDGARLIEYYAVDSFGNAEAVNSYTIKIDSTPPVLASTVEPGWRKGPYTFSVEATDAASGIRTAGLIVTPRYGPGDFYSESCTLYDPGVYTVYYAGIDAAGNRIEYPEIEVGIDNEAPTTWMPWDSGLGEQVVDFAQGSEIVFETHDYYEPYRYEPGSGVAATHYRIDDGNWQEGSSFTPTELGHHVLSYYSVDVAGNVEATKTQDLNVWVRYEQDDPLIRETGTWTTKLLPEASGGSYATSLNNQTVEFDFVGSGVDFVAPPGERYYNIDVYVDGVRLRNSVPFEGHLRLTDLPYGVHRVSLVSHYGPVGYYDVIGLDAVGVFGAIIPQDLKPPVTTSTMPSTWQRDSVTFTLSASSAVGVDSTAVRVGSEPTTNYAGPITVSAEGVTGVQYSSVDITGLREPTQTASVKIDRTAPATTWSNIGGFQTQDLKATDALSGVHHTSYSVDGGPLQTYSGPFDLQPGAHVLTYFSVDVAGNQEPTQTADVFVKSADDVAPVTSCDAPVGWTKGPVTITLTSLETGSGLAGITYRVDSGGYRPYTGPFVIEESGSHVVTYWASDVAGNVETPKSVEVDVDSYGPSILPDVDEGRVVFGRPIALDPWDPYSGVAAVYYRVDGGAWGTGTTVPCPPVGTHRMEYYGVDTIGNISPVRDWDFTVSERTEQETSLVGKRGTWTTTLDAAKSGGSYMVGRAGSTIEAAFEGTGFYLVGPKSRTSGILRITIDGGSPVLVDAYDDPIPWRPTLYLKTGLAPGRHTVKIEVTGTKNAASSGTTVNIDAFDVVGRLVFWDATPPMTAASVPAGWANAPVPVSLSATDTQSGVASTMIKVGATQVQTYLAPVLVSAEGATDLQFWSVDAGGTRESTRTATVRIDLTSPDVSATISDTYIDRAEISLSATDSVSYVDAVEWTVDGTWHTGTTAVIDTPGTHTLRYRARDAAGNLSSEKSATVTVIGRRDQSDSAIYYDGGWATTSLAGSHGGSYAYLASAGYAEFSFEGTSFAWLATKGTAFGIARVIIDGGEPMTVDLYATETLYQQRVLARESLAAGRHTVRIEWTGTKNPAAKTAYVNIDAIELIGPSAGARREQTEPLLHYSGAWYSGNHTSYSGGSYTFLSSAGKVTATFEGNRAQWIATKGTIFGIAKVSVDGGAPTEVDLYAPATTAKQMVFDTGALSPGKHSMTIEYTGRKNAAASSAYVNVDALDLVGKLVPITYEQNDDDIYLQGSWTEKPSASFSGGSYAYLASPGSARINFDGTRIDVIATKGAIFGFAEMRIDGGAPTTVDLYAPGTLYKQRVLSITGLAPGAHTLTIAYTGAKNAAATSAYINVDALELVGNLSGQRYEQTDSHLYLNGDWQTSNSTSFSGGSYAFLPSAGSAHLTVDGTRVAIVATKGQSFGIAEVTVDGAAPVSIDLYAATTQYRQTVFEATGLSPGTHDVVIKWTGRKNASAATAYVNIDAMDLVGQPATKRYEQADALVYKQGAWTTLTSASYSGGSYAYLASAGKCTVALKGTSIELIGTKGPAFGIAKISVDGAAPETVDLYAASTAHRQVIFSRTALTKGAHEITIEWTGTKNPAAATNYINIDAFDVDGFFTTSNTATRTYEQDDAAIDYTASWSTGASASYSGGTYCYASTNAQAAFRFTGTGVRWIATKGPIFGIGEVSVDGGPFQQVDLYAATTRTRETVWEKSGLAEGTHTVIIRWTGNKNPSATRSYVNVDAIGVIGTLER